MAISSSSSSSQTQTQPHVVFFPYMARGHTIPLLDLSMAFVNRGIKVTIITTPQNAPFIISNIDESLQVSLSIIPFPCPAQSGLPQGCENTHDLPSRALLVAFMFATASLRQPFHTLLHDMLASGSLPICVISDFILYWTLDVCRSFGIPRIGAHVGGVLPMTILRTAFLNHYPSIFGATSHEQHIPIDLPGLLPPLPFSINNIDFLDTILQQDPNNFSPSMGPFGEADADSWGTIINSFHELEGQYLPALQSFYKHPIWCLGPFRLHRQVHNHGQTNPTPCYIEWLNKKLAVVGTDSVIYISFGSEADLSEKQIEEIACGVEAAGHPFILVIRSGTWVPCEDEWEEKVKMKEMGLVLRDWVDQHSILKHPATGAFLSHCGWNSVIESLSMGVPILGWPIGADQPINAKVACNGFEAGLIIPPQFYTTDDNKIERLLISRETITDKVKELMEGEVGRKVRDKAKQIGRLAKEAMENGGSSATKLDQLIERLKACSAK